MFLFAVLFCFPLLGFWLLGFFRFVYLRFAGDASDVGRTCEGWCKTMLGMFTG